MYSVPLVSTTHCSLKAVPLKTVELASRQYIQELGGDEGPLKAWVQLTGQPAVIFALYMPSLH